MLDEPGAPRLDVGIGRPERLLLIPLVTRINLVDLASRGAAPATVLDKIRELEALADKRERHLRELGAVLKPLDAPHPENVVARIRHLGALFDLLDDGIQLYPLQNGHYRARLVVYGLKLKAQGLAQHFARFHPLVGTSTKKATVAHCG